MALVTFPSTEVYGGETLIDGFSAQAQGTLVTPTTVPVPTTGGIAAVTVVPSLETAYYMNETGVNGAFIYLSYTPGGSLSGPEVRVQVDVGSFAYDKAYVTAATQFAEDISPYSQLTDNYLFVQQQLQQLLNPQGESALQVSEALYQEAGALASSGWSTLAGDVSTLSQIAGEWDTPEYFLDTGSGWQQVGSTITFGVDLIAVNGAEATWAVSGTSAATVTLQGFTAVGKWQGDAYGYGYTVAMATGESGYLETASISAAHGQSFSGSSLLSYMVSPYVTTPIEYDFWNSGSNGGQFLLSGTALGVNQDDYVSPSQLSSLTYQPGSGADTLWVRSYSGGQWSNWSQAFTITAPIDTGPVVSVTASQSVAHGAVLNASTFISGYSDPFGGSAVSYDFWNSGGGGGYFQLGTLPPYAPNQEIIVSPSALASLRYYAGAGTDELWVRAYDGTVWGAWSQPFNISAPVDTGPVITCHGQQATHGQSYQVSSLFTYSDPFGSAATQYDVWDSGAPGAHFLLNGVALGAKQDNIISASQLSSLTYQSGSGSDTLWIRANDGTLWGNWSQSFTISAPVDPGPTITGYSQQATHGQSYQVSNLFAYSNPFGSAATQYDVWNAGTGGGHFVFGGNALQPGGDNIFTAAQLAYLTYQSGSGSDTLWIRAFDGTVWGNWSASFTITAPIDTGPVVAGTSFPNAAHGQSFSFSQLFSYSDPFNSPATEYDVWNSGSSGGQFVLNGVTLPANQENFVTAAQLSQLSYQSGSGTDTLWARANDGTVWSNWSNAVTVTTPIDTGPVVTGIPVPYATHAQNIPGSQLISYSDPFNSPATEYEFWNSGTGGGHFILNGAALPSNQGIYVPATQLSQLSYQAGSGTDNLWARANDGSVWGNWSSSFIVTGPIDTGPIITPVNPHIVSVQGQVYSASLLFTYSDPFGSAATSYDFWNSGSGGGYFSLNGTKLGANQDNVISASQLSQLSYYIGSGTDELWIRANDGTVWGNWSNPFLASDPSTISADQTLDVVSPTSAEISFVANSGTLRLDDSLDFSGTVAGMAGNDTIDFADINFASLQAPSYSGGSSAGTLTVTDGIHAAQIALLGNYLASAFVASSDGHGGTAITEAPINNNLALATPQHAA
jgi:hypothetical protein